MRNIEKLKERAQNMRINPTFHEKKFKNRLELADLWYKTQWVIGNYIVDFIVENVIIEIDGDSHYDAQQAVYDKERTAYLEGLGYTVIRVRNEDVVSFDMGVLKNKVASNKFRKNAKIKTAKKFKTISAEQMSRQVKMKKATGKMPAKKQKSTIEVERVSGMAPKTSDIRFSYVELRKRRPAPQSPFPMFGIFK